ncbi:MAG: sulfatase-like hydrolase/transferase [Planctomycetota bacterium]
MKKAFVFSLLMLLASVSGAVSVEDAHPNVILMMADDLGWADVGFNGGKIIKTPELDKMAAGGMVFERFYAAAPVCSPTRGSMLTGRHPYRLDIPFANTGHLKPQELTLAEMLREKGYRTGHFGKWHLGTLTKTEKDANRGGPGGAQHFSPPQDNGFDVCLSTESKVPTWDPMWIPKEQKSKQTWGAMKDPEKEGSLYGTYYWNEKGEKVTDNLRGDDSRVIVDRVEPFIRKAAEDKKPFFAVVWFHTPHLPVVAGPKHYAMYPEARNEHYRNYYGCVTAMDDQVGRIRKTLQELGMAENTLLAFCSDNGPEGKGTGPGSAKPFRGRKRSLLEGGVRVPGVIEWPARIKAGSRTQMAVVTSDFVPTVAEVVGAEMTVPPVDGINILPVFAGKMKERPKPIGFASRGQAAWHDGRYKLFRSGGSKPWSLYDLDADPTESKDLAAEMPERVKAMAGDFEKWMQSCMSSRSGADYTEIRKP